MLLRRTYRGFTLAALLAFGLGLLTVGVVSAHAEVVRSDPAPNAVVAAAPATVRIWFSEPVEAPPNALTVTGPDGAQVDRGDARVSPDDATELVARLGAGPVGTYTVRWRAISADTHPVSGSFQFSVGAPSSGAPAPATSETMSGLPWQAAARWLHLLGLVVALGPLSFRLLVVDRYREQSIDTHLWGLSRLGAVIAVVAAPLLLLAEAVGVGGSLSDALSDDVVSSLLAGSYGLRWWIRLGLALLLLALAWEAHRRSRRGTGRLSRRWAIAGLALGAAILLLTSLNGHPTSTDPVWLSVLADWTHLAATVIWIGGLVTFVLALRPALRGRPESERVRALGEAVPRFSTVALVSVELLVVTGLYATWAHVQGPAELTTTDYGRALLIKLGLIAVTLGFAAINLFAIRPRLAVAAHANPHPPAGTGLAARHFERAVAAEALLGVIILAVVGVLTSLPPAEQAPAAAAGPPTPSKPAVTLAQNAGPTLVTLAIDPAVPGSNQLVVNLQDPGGQPVAKASLRVRTQPPAGSGAASLTTMVAEDGHYRATVSLAPAGRWHLEVLVTLPGQAERAAPFDLTVPLPDVTGLLQLADETMNGLRSLVEENELTSGGPVIKTRYEYRAPDRMHFVVQTPSGTSETIAIGATRYDRSEDGPWKETPWPAEGGFHWPDYDFAATATDVTLVGREKLGEVDCFVVAFLEPRSGARYRFWIGTQDHLIHQYVMMATGHYMKSTFFGFNAPLDIQPPGVAGGS